MKWKFRAIVHIQRQAADDGLLFQPSSSDGLSYFREWKISEDEYSGCPPHVELILFQGVENDRST